MKIIIDQAKMERRARFSHTASLGGMLILLGGVAVSMFFPDITILPPILLVGGFGVALVGIYYANRWVRKPRPEDVLNDSLKGLADTYRLYHYLLPADHVLLTPSGVIVIETVALEGEFTYQAGRWQERFNLGRALRFIVEEKLGDPIRTARQNARSVEQLLANAVAGVSVPVAAMVVFTHPNVRLILDNTPIPVRQPHKLSKHLPSAPEKLPGAVYEKVRSTLDAAGNSP